MIIPLAPSLLTGSSSLPGDRVDGPSNPPIWPCSVRGFACHPCYHERGALLPHLFTLTLRLGSSSLAQGRPARGLPRANPEGVSREVRVKRCGKSAPRPWQHGWQAKPRTEQDQIGRRPAKAGPDGPSESPGRSLDLASNGRARGMVIVYGARKRAVSTEFGLLPGCDTFNFGRTLDLSTYF